MSRAVRLLVLLLPLVGSGRRVAAQQAEPVLIELQLGRLTSRTVEAFRSGDAALVPVGAFFDLAEIHSARQYRRQPRGSGPAGECAARPRSRKQEPQVGQGPHRPHP